jgi:hypothetical protein
MANETNVGLDYTLAAGADLSAKQFFFVKVNSSGVLVLCDATVGEGAAGVLQNDPTSGQAAGFRYGGISKVKCGGSFNPGDKVSADSAGKAVKYTTAKVFTGTPYIVSGTTVLGLALSAGVLDQLATIIVRDSGLCG